MHASATISLFMLLDVISATPFQVGKYSVNQSVKPHGFINANVPSFCFPQRGEEAADEKAGRCHTFRYMMYAT